MKDKMAALSATNRNVIGEALTDVSSDVLAQLPKKTSLQRSLRKYRNADHLPVTSSAKFCETSKKLVWKLQWLPSHKLI